MILNIDNINHNFEDDMSLIPNPNLIGSVIITDSINDDCSHIETSTNEDFEFDLNETSYIHEGDSRNVTITDENGNVIETSLVAHPGISTLMLWGNNGNSSFTIRINGEEFKITQFYSGEKNMEYAYAAPSDNKIDHDATLIGDFDGRRIMEEGYFAEFIIEHNGHQYRINFV